MIKTDKRDERGWGWRDEYEEGWPRYYFRFRYIGISCERKGLKILLILFHNLYIYIFI